MGKEAGYSFDMDVKLSDTMDSHRIYLLAEKQGLGEPLAEEVSRRYFEDGALLADRRMLLDVARSVGVTGGEEYLDSEAGYEDVRTSVKEARRMGIHSIPVFIFQYAGEVLKITHGSSSIQEFEQVLRELPGLISKQKQLKA